MLADAEECAVVDIGESVRIDNCKEQLEEALNCEVDDCITETVQIGHGVTVEDFWEANQVGLFLLLIKSKIPRADDLPSVHVIVLDNAELRCGTARMLSARLLGAQKVVQSN